MRTLVLFLLLRSVSSYADFCQDQSWWLFKDEKCFHMICSFKSHSQSCLIQTQFLKRVSVEGSEIQDESSFFEDLQVEMSCPDSKTFYRNARRFTGMLGTRILGKGLPYFSLSLPRGVLHSGGDGKSGPHSTAAFFELDDQVCHFQDEGRCQIWTDAD